LEDTLESIPVMAPDNVPSFEPEVNSVPVPDYKPPVEAPSIALKTSQDDFVVIDQSQIPDKKPAIVNPYKNNPNKIPFLAPPVVKPKNTEETKL
jgi:hypothetical protein